MIIWKVVRPYSWPYTSHDYQHLKSVVIYESQLSVEYKVGKFVKALKEAAKKCYHLTAFKSYENTLDFIRTFEAFCSKFKIYKAEGQNQILPLPPMCDIYVLTHHTKFIPDPNRTWPEGTVMFKKIKLLEEIKI